GFAGSELVNHDVIFHENNAAKIPAARVCFAFETKNVEEQIAITLGTDVIQVHDISQSAAISVNEFLHGRRQVIFVNAGIWQENRKNLHVGQNFYIGRYDWIKSKVS